MAAFRYLALDRQGHEVQGVVDAPTQRHARSQLREQGLLARKIEPAGANRSRASSRSSSFRLGTQARTLLTRQWASLLEAGIPVEKTLAALAEQQNDTRTRELLLALRNELLGGHPLSRALSAHPRCFDTLYCALVAAGEQSGRLGEIMQRLSDTLEARQALRQKLIQATVYPAIIIIVAIAVVLAMMMYVVPQVVAVFQSSRQALPFLTRALIGVSDMLRQIWPFLFVFAIAAAFALRRAWRIDRFRAAMHHLFMRSPMLGALLVTLDSARLAQTLAILFNSGVPLLSALAAGTEVVNLLPLQSALKKAEQAVREGQSLSRALAESRHFPPLFTHMVASGESSGRLGELLDKAATTQNSEVSNRLALAATLIEPLLILCMGSIVLIIVLAILQPIIEINQFLH